MKTTTTHKGNTMQIQLTQDELKDAVRQYVAKDFNLEGRTLTISFTATRGDAGVVTNLSITKTGDADQADIPGYTNASPETVAAANATGAAAQAAFHADIKAAQAAEDKPATTTTTEAKVASTPKVEVADVPVLAAAAASAPVATETVAAASDTPAVTEAPAAQETAAAAPAAEAKTTTSLFD